ncbi:hypothetical protein ACFX15_007457 [Malus domestica]
MAGRRNRGIGLIRHECTGLLKKDESHIPQRGGSGHNFLPPDPGKALFQKHLRLYSPTTHANHLRLFTGGFNEELPNTLGERRHAGAMREGQNVPNRIQGEDGNRVKDAFEGEREVGVTEGKEGPDMQIFHSQQIQISHLTSISWGETESGSMERTEKGSNFAPIATWSGKNKKRELDVINRDVAQSHRKKSRAAVGNKGVNDYEGDGKGIGLVQIDVGASSQGGGGWPSTAAPSP